VALDAVIVLLELSENTVRAELFDINCLDGYSDERVAKIEAILGQDRLMLLQPEEDD